MGHSQEQIDAISNLITVDPMPPVPPLQRLTPRLDALETSQTEQNAALAANALSMIAVSAFMEKFRTKRVTVQNLAGLALSDVTVTWPKPFPDANYTATVSLMQMGVPAGITIDCALVSQTAAGIVVRVKNIGISAQAPVLHAMALHD
ncbi:MAG: hypothetical protein V4671_08395 [Armatimonadota bacterium]